MGVQLSLSALELTIYITMAIIFGAGVVFVVTSNKAYKKMVGEAPGGEISNELAALKSKYNNEAERSQNEIEELSNLLNDIRETSEINAIEAEETKKTNKELKAEIIQLRTITAGSTKTAYVSQLIESQENIKQQQENINRLLAQLEQSESDLQELDFLTKENALLRDRVSLLEDKLKNKVKLSDSNYPEESKANITTLLEDNRIQLLTLQDKIQKLEDQLATAEKENSELKALKIEYSNRLQEVEELQLLNNALTNQIGETEAELNDMQQKLQELNVERQQFLKNAALLEESKNEKVQPDYAKEMQLQFQRISELEKMLHIIINEKNELMRKHSSGEH